MVTVNVRHVEPAVWKVIKRGAAARSLMMGAYLGRLVSVHELAKQLDAGRISVADFRDQLRALEMNAQEA